MTNERLTIAQGHAMDAARLLLLYVSADELRALLDEYSRMDAVMPIFDPTGYRAVMGNIPQYRRVVAALAHARSEIAAVLAAEGITGM